MDNLKRSSIIWVPTLISKLDIIWDTIEFNLTTFGSTGYLVPIKQFIFGFFTRCLIGQAIILPRESQLRLQNAGQMVRPLALPHCTNQFPPTPPRDLPPLLSLPFCPRKK
ncbi:hypothetical protein LguiA_022744 [Lonicera macranthoides]